MRSTMKRVRKSCSDRNWSSYRSNLKKGQLSIEDKSTQRMKSGVKERPRLNNLIIGSATE